MRRSRRSAVIRFGTMLTIPGLLIAGFLFFREPAPEISPDNDASDADRWVVGALHVHSRYSDGLGEIADISRAAAAAGLDFWVLTDHQRLDGPLDQGEGYSDGVLRLIEVEVSTDAGHVLGLDLPATPLRFGSDATEVLRQIAELGGFAIAAHPNTERPDFTWTGWSLDGIHGIEVFNTYAAYRRNGVLRSLAYLLLPAGQIGPWKWHPDWDTASLGTWERSRDRKLSAWAQASTHTEVSSCPATTPWVGRRTDVSSTLRGTTCCWINR